MEENKYICPKCGAEMIVAYEKPALNLTCPKCDCRIATTRWEEIDLDDTNYQIILKSSKNPSMAIIKFISKKTGLNFIDSKKLLESGGLLMEGKAITIKEQCNILDDCKIEYIVIPEFPY